MVNEQDFQKDLYNTELSSTKMGIVKVRDQRNEEYQTISFKTNEDSKA